MKQTLRNILIACVVAIAAALPVSVQAQEDFRFEVGGGLGMTGYLGDANTANLWGHPGWDITALMRYLPNNRFAFKTNLYVGSVSGNSADMENVFPDMQTYKFRTTFYEIGELVEFNFFKYGMGESYRKLKRWSPYITAGLSLLVWSNDGRGSATVAIPLGAGVKFKLNRRVNLGMEFLMKKTLSDRVDGKELSDPYGIKHAFMKNTDWISTLSFTISYEFSERCRACNYKE
ncbi:MAG: porin family protein [Muribaculaceae bacterium]|nr:porin family protein [Muribaculaceae bacterium]